MVRYMQVGKVFATIGTAVAAGIVVCSFAANAQERERPRSEREAALRQLEIMRSGLEALREAEKQDAAELLHRAIRAREVVLERRDDDEAYRIREQTPGRGVQAEVLALAAEVLADFGQIERAMTLRRLSMQLANADRPERGERRELGEREREREREVDLPREVWAAIDQLREHGNTEIAAALQRRVMTMMRENRIDREPPQRQRIREREQRREREVRQDREQAENVELQHAVAQLREQVNAFKKQPPVHPEVSHVLRELRDEVRRLREELNELKSANNE